MRKTEREKERNEYIRAGCHLTQEIKYQWQTSLVFSAACKKSKSPGKRKGESCLL